MKKCARCRVVKEEKEFINKKGKEAKTCNKCRESMGAYYNKHREEELERSKVYREQNRYEVLKRKSVYMKEYYEQHRTEVLCRNKIYREQNRNKHLERKKAYYERNKDKCLEHTKAWGSLPARYNTFANRLTVLEAPVEGRDGELLVCCAKCSTYFTPTNRSVQKRVWALNSNSGAENRLYCSSMCKNLCEVYKKKIDPAERASRIERDPIWSKKIKKRANYVCERCGSKEKLEAHHEIAVKVDSTKANDLDNGICLCHECHMKAHSESGCTLADLRKI